jgi:hypothetical protein
MFDNRALSEQWSLVKKDLPTNAAHTVPRKLDPQALAVDGLAIQTTDGIRRIAIIFELDEA